MRERGVRPQCSSWPCAFADLANALCLEFSDACSMNQTDTLGNRTLRHEPCFVSVTCAMLNWLALLGLQQS